VSNSESVPVIPRWLLISAGVMIALTILSVLVSRLTGIGATMEPVSPALYERHFRFEERTDGSIAIFDLKDKNRLVDRVVPGTNGFLRGTLRGLARDRIRQKVAPEAPFRLTGREDGRLVLDDLETRRHIDLGAFGPTNSELFVHLLLVGNSKR
jgi:putative photosynthetic complex assembly protein